MSWTVRMATALGRIAEHCADRVRDHTNGTADGRARAGVYQNRLERVRAALVYLVRRDERNR